MLEKNRYALKEWAVVVHALLTGKQVVLLRKGGIFEKRGEFEVEHREFFLFPTLYHEKEHELVPSYRADMAAAERNYPVGTELRLPGYGVVEDHRWVDDLDKLQSLEGLHPLTPTAVEYRFNYGKQRGLHVLTLRTFRLDRPHVLPMERCYDGCVSWVDLARDLPTQGAAPVLSDSAFAERVAAVRDRLGA